MGKTNITAITDEIKSAIETAPVHGSVTLTLIFRDSVLDRWNLAREESKKAITGGDIATSGRRMIETELLGGGMTKNVPHISKRVPTSRRS